MNPFHDSQSAMDAALYQQLQLSPPWPSPKPEQSLLHYPCSPPFATASFHLSYLAAATPPSAAGIDSPELLAVHPLMEQPAPATETAGGAASSDVQCVAGGGGGVDGAARKDRHSKICTAGGMRDRRMRLSLDVARKFFALQDMLGFDKASKTVQWLLNMSKGAIREIMAAADGDGASSECEEDGSSSLSVDGKSKPPPLAAAANSPGGAHESNRGEEKKPARGRKAAATTPKQSRKSGNVHLVPDKESRAKARERARERTKEKNRMRWVTLASTINVEPAAAPPRPSDSTRSSSMNMASPELEDKCSSAAAARIQEMSMASEARDVMLAFGLGGFGSSSGYYGQEQSELGRVVFSNSRLY